MADEADKQAEAAEKAYATASEALPVKAEAAESTANARVAPAAKTVEAQPVATKPVEAAVPAAKPVPATTAAAKTAAVTKSAAPKAPANKAAVTPKAAAKPTKALATAKAKPAAKPKAKAALPKIVPPKIKSPKIELKPAAKKVASPKPAIKLKEFIMAKTPDFTKSVTDAVAELQSRAKGAYEKSTEVAGEVSEFTKGNVEALVESGKIFSEGLQELGKTYADEAKTAFETATADLKELAAIKSPTELFQLQGKLLRRNFDTFAAFSSKNSEAIVKLANEGIAPISGRLSLAAEKVSKAA